MVDLYSAESDLFVAGMAAGGSRVAVFSFHRYSPFLRMSPEVWHDYGFAARPGSDSYYRGAASASALAPAPPSRPPPPRAREEALRRAAKLLVHEIAHLYGIDHCVRRDCVMRGTGHLVEDFAAPSHVCEVDLRKLQFRLGFALAARHASLAAVYARWGLKREAAWERARAAEAEAAAAPSPDVVDLAGESPIVVDLVSPTDDADIAAAPGAFKRRRVASGP